MKKSVYAVLLVGALIGGPIGASIQEHIMRPKIIENGAGHYDQLTGQFLWGAPEQLAAAYIGQKAADLRSKPQIDAALANALKGGRQ